MIKDIVENSYMEDMAMKVSEKIKAVYYCNVFLDIGVIRENDKITLCHDRTGYCAISKLGRIDVTDALNIIIFTAVNIDRAADLYVFPEEYILNEDTLFINRDGDVKFMFCPVESEQIDLRDFLYEKKEEDFYRGAIEIGNFLYSQVGKLEKPYVKRAISIFDKREFGIESAIRDIERLKREAYRCGVIDKDMADFLRSP